MVQVWRVDMMIRNTPARFRRRSIGLKEYDRSLSGAHFLTICVQDGENILSEIVDGPVMLKDPGLYGPGNLEIDPA